MRTANTWKPSNSIVRKRRKVCYVHLIESTSPNGSNMSGLRYGLKFNMLITFFHLNAFFPLHLSESVVEYIYNKKLTITTGV